MQSVAKKWDGKMHYEPSPTFKSGTARAVPLRYVPTPLIPGHAHIHYNDLADRAAKQAVIDAADLRPISRITLLTCKKLISKQCQSRWQRCWDRATKGRVTHDLIPTVNPSRIYLNARCCAISFVRLLLNDSMLKAHQHKCGLEHIHIPVIILGI